MADRPTATRRQSLREEQKAVTRRRLLESALRVFDARGFPAATLDEIAVDAGVNRGTIYLHFKNKGDIVVALVSDVELDYAPLYDAIRTARTRPELELAFDRVIAWWLETASPQLRHARHAAMLDPDVGAWFEKGFEWTVTIMEDILVGRGVDRAVAKARAFLLTAMFADTIERIAGGLPYGIARPTLRDALVDAFQAAATP